MSSPVTRKKHITKQNISLVRQEDIKMLAMTSVRADMWWRNQSGKRCCCTINKGSGYRTIDGSLNLKPYLTISCNVTALHEENAVGFVETYQT